MAVDPIPPVGPRPDLAPVERVQLTRGDRDEARRERERRRRKRAESEAKRSNGGGREGLDVRA